MENYCVGCKPDLPCLGPACPYHDPFPVYHCDECGSDDVVCHIDGKDYCESCAKRLMIEEFSNLTLLEMAELLDLDFSYS